MVLAIDIGNTHILLGCFEERKVLFTELLTTDKTATELEYASFIKSALEFNGRGVDEIEGVIISSVVPQVTGTIKKAVERFSSVEPIVVGPGVKLYLPLQASRNTAFPRSISTWEPLLLFLLSTVIRTSSEHRSAQVWESKQKL